MYQGLSFGSNVYGIYNGGHIVLEEGAACWFLAAQLA